MLMIAFMFRSYVNSTVNRFSILKGSITNFQSPVLRSCAATVLILTDVSVALMFFPIHFYAINSFVDSGQKGRIIEKPTPATQSTQCTQDGKIDAVQGGPVRAGAASKCTLVPPSDLAYDCWTLSLVYSTMSSFRDFPVAAVFFRASTLVYSF